MTTQAHYEVRPEGTRPGEFTAKTGGATEAEFNYASGQLARAASIAERGRRFEVRYQGYSEGAQDLLVAAWLDGEQLDIRTQQARDEHLSR
jgi:hypothetical protein